MFWNGFERGLQPEEKRKSHSKKSTTPRSGKRKRMAISPIIVDQPSSPSKTKKAIRNLDFNKKGKEILAQSENSLNLPYSDSEEEREEGADLAEQVVAKDEELPSPTPKEDQGEPMEKASFSKPRLQRVNQLLRKVYELEVLEREIKRTNAVLTKKNTHLSNSLLEMKGRYFLLQKRNLRFMKDNTKIYRMIRLLRLQMKNPNSNPSSEAHFALETLAEAATSFQDPEAAHDAVALSNPMQIEEIPKGQR